MTEKKSDNCIVCADEFSMLDIEIGSKAAEINYTNFKVCNACITSSDPTDDYKEVKSIVQSYLKCTSEQYFTDALILIKESMNVK